MKLKRITAFIICFLLAFQLCGCGIRARVTEEDLRQAEAQQEETPPEEVKEEKPEEEAPPPEENRDLPSEEDPESDRREFSQDSSGEISPDAETQIIAQPEPPKEEKPKEEAPEEKPPAPPAPVPVSTSETAPTVPVETAEETDKTVTEKISAEEAENLTASEDAPQAEDQQTYYRALLDSRLGDLFECKRLDVYMESPEDYVTVHKSSAGHELILLSGAYDVSAKLKPDDLVISDDWLLRKNPGAYIKLVDSSVLGSSVGSTSAAESAALELLARPGWDSSEAGKNRTVIVISDSLLRSNAGKTAAAVCLAKAMYPTAFKDVNADEALKALLKESSGSEPSGCYYYVLK